MTRVLIIDDDTELCELLQQYLSVEGFEIDDLTSKIGGQVPLEGDSKLFPESVLSSKDRRKIEPFIEFAMISEKEAIGLL